MKWAIYEQELELEWHLGFIRSAKMAWAMYDDEGNGHRKAGKDFGMLLDLPAARFIRSLHLGPVPSDNVKLNLNDNGLTNASKPKVGVLAKNVELGKSQDPDRAGEDHYRYCSVAE